MDRVQRRPDSREGPLSCCGICAVVFRSRFKRRTDLASLLQTKCSLQPSRSTAAPLLHRVLFDVDDQYTRGGLEINSFDMLFGYHLYVTRRFILRVPGGHGEL